MGGWGHGEEAFDKGQRVLVVENIMQGDGGVVGKGRGSFERKGEMLCWEGGYSLVGTVPPRKGGGLFKHRGRQPPKTSSIISTGLAASQENIKAGKIYKLPSTNIRSPEDNSLTRQQRRHEPRAVL